jgi:replicative DNA helicase
MKEITGFYNFEQYIDESYMDLTSNSGEYDAIYSDVFLTDAIGGIVKSELIVIGADSGAGKTEKVNSIAYSNAAKGLRVHVFSLEGDKYDFINRQKYKQYIKAIIGESFKELYTSYRDFLINRIPAEGRSILLQIDEGFKKIYPNLFIYDRRDMLNISRFEAHLDLLDGRTDLVIVDHLHYFEFLSKNEYSELNDIMRKIKTLQSNYRIPIILVSHLRKKGKDRAFPDQEDFHGSSNIVKQADTVIILSPMELKETPGGTFEEQIERGLYKTGVRIAKCRTGFSRNIIGIMEYNIVTREYTSGYELAICGSDYIQPMSEDKYPKWSKHAKKS